MPKGKVAGEQAEEGSQKGKEGGPLVEGGLRDFDLSARTFDLGGPTTGLSLP